MSKGLGITRLVGTAINAGTLNRHIIEGCAKLQRGVSFTGESTFTLWILAMFLCESHRLCHYDTLLKLTQ